MAYFKGEREKTKTYFVPRADPTKLQEVFYKYASVEKDGVKYMTYDDFMRRYLGLFGQHNYSKDTLNILARVARPSQPGIVSIENFKDFEELLCAPDALYALAFRIFDSNRSGLIGFDNFKKTIENTQTYRHLPFDFESEFIFRFFGADLSRQLHFAEFTQILHDFHEEHAIQAFKRFDEESTGFITTLQFQDIIITLKDHLLTPAFRSNLSRFGGLAQAYKVSYGYFVGFLSLLNNMELIKRIYLGATGGVLNKFLTKDEFLWEAHEYTQITPLEITILFQIMSIIYGEESINYTMLDDISPTHEHHLPFKIAKLLQERVQDVQQKTSRRSVLVGIFENFYRFSLGAIAGAIGAATVYPIDLVKTRIQNQRSTIGEVMYRNSFDCFKKVIRFEGISGLYRGLAPQLIGVAPEKAIKLTVNDLVRDQFTDSTTSEIAIWAELLAGICAGTSQVMFTNPLEIVKIRLQVAGEIATGIRPSAMSVVRELGFFGLYKGARACILRDAPFSAMYFTSYAHIKRKFADENGYNSPISLLVSATMAGAPAACLSTPADVIKTRLQVVARKGQTTYNGLYDCVKKIFAEEGGRALWKGAVARMLRSSPQFGVTMMSYELLQRIFYVDFGGRKLEGADLQILPEDVLPKNPDHIGGYKLALATFSGIETKFGLHFPKYRSPYQGG